MKLFEKMIMAACG